MFLLFHLTYSPFQDLDLEYVAIYTYVRPGIRNHFSMPLEKVDGLKMKIVDR